MQGLVILDALIGAGYSCALVTEGDVGAGQTLHSHGLLNTGFGMSDPALPRAAVEIVYPFFRDRGIELSDAWIVLPMPEFPALTTLPPRICRSVSRQLSPRLHYSFLPGVSINCV